MNYKHKIFYLALILLLALAIRLTYIYQLDKAKIYYLPTGIDTDMEVYDKFATGIVKNGILSNRDVKLKNYEQFN
jgi:hypothetical protein